MPYVGRDLQRGNYLKLDDISSSFNGSLTTFNLTSGGNAFFPGSAFSIIVSLGGVVQEPESAFQIDRSQIIFATAPTSSSDFFCIALGVALGVGVPGHNTVGNNQLAKPLSYGDYFRWDSANNRVGINTLLPSTALDVVGSATFSGNVSIGGTLTYEDVANIDAVGIITARAGIEDKTLTAGRVVYAGAAGRLVDNSALTFNPTTLNTPGLNVVGVSTFAGNVTIVKTAGPLLELTTNTGAADATLRLSEGSTGSTTNGGGMVYSGADNKLHITCGTDSTTKRITILRDDGKVGINSTVPTNSLDINAAAGVGIRLLNATTNNSVYFTSEASDKIQFNVGGTGSFAFLTSGSEKLTLTNAGNLGISTTVPAERLSVAVPGNQRQNIAKFEHYGQQNFFIQGQWGSADIGGANGTLLYGSGTVALRAATSGNAHLVNLANGNIGIGTNNPGNKLEVYGTATATVVEVNGPGRYRGYEIHESGTRKAYFFHDATNNEAILNTAESTLQFAIGDTPVMKLNANGDLVFKDGSSQGNSLSSKIIVTDSSDNVQYEIGMLSTGNEDLYISNSRNSNIRFRTNGSTRWKIDGDPGHLLPETAGAVNIGSTGAEIGHVYLADDKRVYFGTDQDLSMYSSGTNGFIDNGTGYLLLDTTSDLVLRADADIYLQPASGENAVKATGHGSVDLYYDQSTYTTPKLKTSATGITVDGEVAASQDYPNFRPTLDFNFASSTALDPRITYSRTGPASFLNENGKIEIVGPDIPRFDHDPSTREPKGLLVEPSRTNIVYNASSASNGIFTENEPNSLTGNNDAVKMVKNSPSGNSQSHINYQINGNGSTTSFVASVFVQKTNHSRYFLQLISTNVTDNFYVYYNVDDGGTSATDFGNPSNNITSTRTLESYPDNWYRLIVRVEGFAQNTFNSFRVGLGHPTNGAQSYQDTTDELIAYGAQIEVGNFVTSYIPTYGSAVTRGGDIPRVNGKEFDDAINLTEGTFIVEYDNVTNDGYIVSLDDGNNKIGMVNSNSYQLMGQSGGASQGTTDNGTLLSGTNRFALAYKTNDAAISMNGNTATVDTSYALPTPIYLWIGHRQGQYDFLGSTISRLLYYNKRLPNSQLKTLSTR